MLYTQNRHCWRDIYHVGDWCVNAHDTRRRKATWVLLAVWNRRGVNTRTTRQNEKSNVASGELSPSRYDTVAIM